MENIKSIVETPRLASILIGSNDLANSMGFVGQPRHPEVIKAIEHVVRVTHRQMCLSDLQPPMIQMFWSAGFDAGVQWLTMGADCSLLIKRTQEIGDQVRGTVNGKYRPADSF